MKIKELVEMYKTNRMLDLKKILDVKEYVGIAYKQKTMELVINECIREENGVLKFDSLSRYILFTVAVLGLHTNLDFSDDNNEDYSVVDDLDMLFENHLLDKIVDTFREDYNACQIILDMIMSDKVKNHDIPNDFSKEFMQFQNVLNNLENKDEILQFLGIYDE